MEQKWYVNAATPNTTGIKRTQTTALMRNGYGAQWNGDVKMSEEVAPESVSLEEAIEGFGDNPPDGFVFSMIFWNREPNDTTHPIHVFLEMLKMNFNLHLSKRDVVIKNLHFYQVDIFWYGEVKYMQKAMEDIDKIIGENMKSMNLKPDMNVGFCMKPPEETENPDDDLF